MTTNPFYNALLALGYVLFVVTLINIATHFAGPGPDNNFFAPVAMLSLLTLSASVMAYVFFYQPLVLFLDGKRKEGARLFLQTVGIFAGLTSCIVIAAWVIF